MTEKFTIGLIGARGYVGREILRLIAGHPQLVLRMAVSRELAGQPVSQIAPEIPEVSFENLDGAGVAARGCDVCILALPDGAGATYVAALSETPSILIDLSSDYRFDDGWAYGLPELYRAREGLAGAQRIANPGCYATAAQLAIHPALPLLAESTIPAVFGVSGYSGAGTTPSPRNDPAVLADNLLPYGLTGHKHEREIFRHLRHEVSFTPHVHSAFSGLLVTVHLTFNEAQRAADLLARYKEVYRDELLISVRDSMPTLKEGAGQPGALIGAPQVAAGGMRGVVVVAQDNLLKGAAVQAIQNINLAVGLDEMAGLSPAAG